MHDVLVRELARARDRAGDERLADRAVLRLVALVEMVELVVGGAHTAGPENVRRAAFATGSMYGTSATR